MRSLVAAVVLLVGALMVPVATAGWWLRDTVVPTDAYVATVAPLATNKAVVTAVENRLVDQTMQQVNRSGAVAQAPQVVRARIATLVRRAVSRVVEDPKFAQAWRASNRVAHDQLVAVLSGDSSAVSVGKDSTVDIKLATLATAIRQELVDANVPFADSLPALQASLPIGNVHDLARAQQAYTLLDRWGRLLPLAALVVIAAGLLLARNRVRALGWTALAALGGLGLLAVGLVVGRTVYLASLPSGISDAAAKAVFTTVTAGLRHDMLLVAGGTLAVLAVTAVAGRRTPRRSL